MPEYAFTRAMRQDFPMLRDWLAMPHVAQAWGDPDEEIALIEAEIDGGDCQMHVVSVDDTPVGYIQDWCPHLAGVPHMTDQPAGTRAVDTFLGSPDHLGKGHAKAYVRRYAKRLLSRAAARVVTDPHLTNPRGIAMYRAAGFRPGPQRTSETGAQVVLMTFAP